MQEIHLLNKLSMCCRDREHQIWKRKNDLKGKLKFCAGKQKKMRHCINIFNENGNTTEVTKKLCELTS